MNAYSGTLPWIINAVVVPTVCSCIGIRIRNIGIIGINENLCWVAKKRKSPIRSTTADNAADPPTAAICE